MNGDSPQQGQDGSALSGMVIPANDRGSTMLPHVPSGPPNPLAALFGDRDTKNQYRAMRAIDHAAERTAFAMALAGPLTNLAVDVSLETAAGVEASVNRFSGSQYVMAVAPAIVQRVQHVYVEDIPNMLRAGIDRMCREVSR